MAARKPGAKNSSGKGKVVAPARPPVKVIDDRGNELLVLKNLREAEA